MCMAYTRTSLFFLRLLLGPSGCPYLVYEYSASGHDGQSVLAGLLIPFMPIMHVRVPALFGESTGFGSACFHAPVTSRWPQHVGFQVHRLSSTSGPLPSRRLRGAFGPPCTMSYARLPFLAGCDLFCGRHIWHLHQIVSPLICPLVEG